MLDPVLERTNLELGRNKFCQAEEFDSLFAAGYQIFLKLKNKRFHVWKSLLHQRRTENPRPFGFCELFANASPPKRYDYINDRVANFGTAFMQSDFAGQEVDAYLVFRVTTGNGTIGQAHFHLKRQ